VDIDLSADVGQELRAAVRTLCHKNKARTGKLQRGLDYTLKNNANKFMLNVENSITRGLKNKMQYQR
jgi:hypothetical protein